MKFITLSPCFLAIVDDNAHDWLKRFTWHAKMRPAGVTYACTNLKTLDGYKYCAMHQMILPTPRGFEIDHINGNGLDNRLENLRAVTHKQNMANRKGKGISGYRGVSYQGDEKRKPWKVDIAGKYIGAFFTAEEAALKYNEVAKDMYGEHAYLNVIKRDKNV